MLRKVRALLIIAVLLPLLFTPLSTTTANLRSISDDKIFGVANTDDNITLPDESQYLNGHTFDEEHWSTVVDWIEILTDINSTLRDRADVYTYLCYVNKTDYQMLYIGFINTTLTIPIKFLWWTFNVTIGATMPMQTVLQHYKTPNGKDAFIISTFLLMAAFQDTGIIKGVPDALEPLYLALTFDLKGTLGEELKENFNVSLIPLSVSENGTHYEWGMSYYNLKTIWWWFNPFEPSKPGHVVATAEFKELTFKYYLDIDRKLGQVILSNSYEVGPIEWLKVGSDLYCGMNLTEFMASNNFSLTLASYQASIIVGHTHKVVTDEGGTLTGENFTDVSDGNITTLAGTDNERIMDTVFSTKKTYNLYNETSGTYNSTDLLVTTYTYPLGGMRKNPLVGIQQIINAPLPIVALYLDPNLVEAYNNGTLNETVTIEGADCLYVVSYPTWYGLKVEHDPVIVVYIPPEVEGEEEGKPAGGGVLGLILIAVAIIVVAIIVKKRRK